MFRTALHLRKPASSLLGALTVGLTLATASVAPALGQQQYTQLSIHDFGQSRQLELEVNKSMLIDLPADVAEVVISNPEIAGAIMRTTRRAILQGVNGGDTNVLFLDATGRPIAVFDLKVAKERSQVGVALESALARIIPGSAIKVDSVTLTDTNRVVLSGTVLSRDDADRALSIATQYAGGPENVASVIDISGNQQVMLQVTVSEINRSVAKQLGINLSGTLSVGSVNFAFNNATQAPIGVPGMAPNSISGNFPIGTANIDAAIQALETRNALRILAQPTLTALSGEPAKFLAGGELPYDVSDGNGGVTKIFKPYGVELSFTPVIKSNGVIALTIDTSVSEPQANSSLTKRQANTSVELQAGTTLAIGGLLQETTRRQIDQLPGLGNIPILGALFRSTDYRAEQTELVILVTPYLVAPSPANAIPLPTDSYNAATDAEAIFLGQMEHNYGVGNGSGMRGGFSGSVGFVLD